MSTSRGRLGVSILQGRYLRLRGQGRAIALSGHRQGPGGTFSAQLWGGGNSSTGVPFSPEASLCVSAEGSFSRGGMKGRDPITNDLRVRKEESVRYNALTLGPV